MPVQVKMNDKHGHGFCISSFWTVVRSTQILVLLLYFSYSKFSGKSVWLNLVYFQDYPVRDDLSLGLLFVVKLPLRDFIQRMLELNDFPFFRLLSPFPWLPLFVLFLCLIGCSTLVSTTPYTLRYKIYSSVAVNTPSHWYCTFQP